MRIILQRVTRAAVRVDRESVAEIEGGALLLVGLERGDGPAQVAAAAEKLAGLRIWDDERGRMNRSPAEAGARFLVVSQFTLAAATDEGRRPSFGRALPAGEARPLIDSLADELRLRGFVVACGRFGARMEVELVNDGPVTFVLDF